jgi:hypothetical protein
MFPYDFASGPLSLSNIAAFVTHVDLRQLLNVNPRVIMELEQSGCAQINSFSEALSTMDLSAFEPRVCAEADDKAVQVSEEAAISRLRPIKDGLDFLGVHGCAVTGSDAPAPGLPVTGLGNVLSRLGVGLH